ncbi:hypothetical protein WS89_31240 [Burkholderia sp. MSMB1072]|nr:hypothetical protein WS89_31240 [Burkholderia sp. MSMB1072]
MTPEWRAFFLSLFTRTGGSGGDDSATIRADLNKAIKNISDLQTESQQGRPSADLGMAYSMIFAIEALAAQAMASAWRTPDERGDSGEALGTAQMAQRIAELEQQLEHYRSDDALRQRIADLEARLDGVVPVVGDASQITGLGTMAKQDANAVAITGGSAAFTAPSSVTDSSNSTATLTLTNTGSNGANLKLVGNGTTTPNKYVRVNAGVLQIANSAYSAIILALTDAGNFSIAGTLTSGDNNLMRTSVSLTNGAAAQTATLANAPVAGNPTKWVPINDNGTTRYMPAW